MMAISMNSANMKRPIFIALYSVKYPAMSSDSASGRSKGMRLFSAMAAVRKRMAAKGWYTIPQAGRKPSATPDCWRTASPRSSVP